MIYSEKQNLVWWVKYLFLLIFGGIILGVILSPQDPETPFWVAPFLILLGILFFFIFINFRILEIKVQGRFLEFGFGIIKKKILRSDIVSCEKSSITFWRYGGIGIRLGMDGTVCYNTRFGKGVRIKVKNKKRDYVLTSDNPQALCQALKAGL
ncbi:MAG TPA: hypothetical protein VGB01_06340 [candidate division Zixibacteria bacterium]|jgi:hypothetical protein